MLLALRQLCAELRNRFAATDGLAEIGLTADDVDTLRDLACALVLSGKDIATPEAPYLSEFEGRFLALLGDRQRDPAKRVGLPVPAYCDTRMLDEVADLLNEHKLRISYSSIVCGGDMSAPERGSP